MVLERVACQILPYSATYYIITYYLVLFLTISWPTISSSTTSALAARATYLSTQVLAATFSSPQLSIFIRQQSTSFGSEAFVRAVTAFHYNADFFYKRRGQGQGFRLDKPFTLYIKL